MAKTFQAPYGGELSPGQKNLSPAQNIAKAQQAGILPAPKAKRPKGEQSDRDRVKIKAKPKAKANPANTPLVKQVRGFERGTAGGMGGLGG